MAASAVSCSSIKVLFVSLLIGNTLDVGREPPRPRSRVSDRPGVPFSRGLYAGPSFFSPQKSCLLQGPPGVARSPPRSVLPRDDPALALSGGNLSPFLMDPLSSPQGCNTRTQASQRTTQDDEIHVQPQNSHTTLPLARYQTTNTHTDVYMCVWGCVYLTDWLGSISAPFFMLIS